MSCRLKSPETWKALNDGDFCVKKSGTSFTNIFLDQTLEQEIRGLKVVGGITGLTENKLTPIVTEFKRQYDSAAEPAPKNSPPKVVMPWTKQCCILVLARAVPQKSGSWLGLRVTSFQKICGTQRGEA